MKQLSNQQVQQLLNEIDKSMLMFLSTQIGDDVLTKEDVSFLYKNGIDIKKFQQNPQEPPLIQAFKFGIIAEAMGQKESNKMSYKQFQDFITSGKFIKLTYSEQHALDYIKKRSYSDIKGLGNKISSKTGKILIERDYQKRIKLQRLVEDKTKQAIENRKSIKQLAADLRSVFKESTRDFERMADYLMHEAYSHGKVMSMLRDDSVDNISVYFLVSKNACKTCQELYLNKDYTPKVFKLDDILTNGNNIGRKQTELLPTVPPLHPRCRCNIMKVRQGMEFDSNTGAFTKVDKTQRNVLKERGVKIKVKIG